MPDTTATPDVEDQPQDEFEVGDAEHAIDGEVAVAELVPAPDDRPGAEAAHAAIEAAARMALEQPALAGRDEFLSLAMQARMIAGTGLCPGSLRGKPADVFLILLTGRDLGIPATSALRKVYVVDGQPSLAPQLKLALTRRQGLGQVVPHPGNDDHSAGAIPLGPDGVPLGPPIVVTWEDAQLAGLVLDECQPDAHSDRCRADQKDKQKRHKCKANWYAYPRRMLWWRAAGYCVDDYFPEVSMGLYSPDELGAVTDTDGRPIDPATVELPEGFEAAERATGGRPGAPAVGQVADADVVAELVVRAKALPDEQRKALNEAWKNSTRVAHLRIEQLPTAEVAYVNSMLNGFERLAERAGWDGEVARAAVREQLASTESTPEGPESAPDPEVGTDAVSQPDDAADGALGADVATCDSCRDEGPPEAGTYDGARWTCDGCLAEAELAAADDA